MKTSELLQAIITLEQFMDGISEEKPKTNADRIRAMTDEELAKWLDGELPSKPKEWWLDWLKEEAID